MAINIRGAVVAGLVWGVIALLLSLLVTFVPVIGQLVPPFAGVTLGLFAVLFAGVHYAARNKGGLLQHLIGGIIAGIIAALFLMVISLIVPAVNRASAGGGIVPVLITGLVGGAFGALGMWVVNKVNF